MEDDDRTIIHDCIKDINKLGKKFTIKDIDIHDPNLYKMLNTEEVKKLDALPKNKANGPIQGSLGGIFKNGRDYGIYFISGVITADVSTDIPRTDMFKEYTAYATAMHFGGMLNNCKTFKYTGPLSGGNQATAKNIATLSDGASLRSVYVPEYLE